MDHFTLEVCSIVVKHLDQHHTTAALCRVSRLFRRAAEPALYRIIFADNLHTILAVCTTLASSSRLALLVESLTVISSDDEDPEASAQDPMGGCDSSTDALAFWQCMKKALANTRRLRNLDIEVQVGLTSACAWIYPQGPSSFQLHTLRCDFDWDHHLVAFLDSQVELEDLYIMDFKAPPSTPSTITPTTATFGVADSEDRSLDASSLPNLGTLECTFSEAACALVPNRPITHLKTCFSTVDLLEKRREMVSLLENVALARAPLRSLDIADSSYDEGFSMELLERVAQGNVTRPKLKYFGTLVLPVDGALRLRFYGHLMRLPSLQCLEVEISNWSPAPSSPAAFRALANELRIYCRRLETVVFVLDLDRTIVTLRKGSTSWLVTEDNDYDNNAENIWKEV